MADLTKIINQDYYDIFLKHIKIFHEEINLFFEEYPSIKCINLDNMTISLNGVAYVNEDKSEFQMYPGGGNWGGPSSEKVNYSVVVEDKEGNTHRLKSVFSKLKELAHFLAKINKNPAIEKVGINVYNRADTCIPSFKKIYGEAVANFLLSTQEKKQLSMSIDASIDTPRAQHKI